MKAYKIKKTLVQEFVSFGDTREQAIENFEYSQGHDFDSVTINGDIYTNGEVLSSKTTATSMGADNLIVFNAKNWKFAKAMWLRNHNDLIMVKEVDDSITPAQNYGYDYNSEQIPAEIREEIYTIADRYTGKS